MSQQVSNAVNGQPNTAELTDQGAKELGPQLIHYLSGCPKQHDLPINLLGVATFPVVEESKAKARIVVREFV
jgi:hypothetical protein